MKLLYMSDIDLNISNYSDEELYQLIGLTDEADRDEIYSTTSDQIGKYTEQGNTSYAHFFTSLQDRLLTLMDTDEGNDTGGDFIKTEYEPNPSTDQGLVNRSNYTTIVNDEHFTLRQQRLLIPQGVGVPYAQGQMNPTLRNTKRQLISIDSNHRELMSCLSTESSDCSGNICTTNNYEFSESATDFTFDLSHPITNVLKLKLYSYEIPHSWYVFDPQYGTTHLAIDISGSTAQCLDISAGNYDPSGLIIAINNAITSILPLHNISVTYNTINNKVTFTDLFGDPFTLVFYDASGICPPSICGVQGPKLNHNLGWLLGFRKTSYSGSSSYEGESLIDTYGFRYIFVELKDFNNNRLNQGIVSITDNRHTFTYSAAKRCRLPLTEEPLNSTSCGKSPPSWRGPPLTSTETYVRAQLLNAQERGYPDQYLSPVNSDILARIPVRKFNHYDILFDNWTSTLEDTSREYFGPVTLKRMHVRLLNDKGYVIDLNGMDFSFSLIAEHLYQY